jgi:glycosyltransferase involved in cell wall biosynthesis
VITNGIDVQHFSSAHQEGSRAREFMHVEDDFVWLAAGRVVPAKDFDNLIAAFRQVRAERPNTQLWIAGELDELRLVRIGGEVVGTERYESEGIRWLGFCEDMAATIAPADAFVLSSAWEGMPLVVGEAMAMEKPVVATDVGGVKELVGEAGFSVPTKDSKALAEAMLRVMNMTLEQRRAMGKAGRERICAHFDMRAKAAEWEALYARLIDNSR